VTKQVQKLAQIVTKTMASLQWTKTTMLMKMKIMPTNLKVVKLALCVLFAVYSEIFRSFLKIKLPPLLEILKGNHCDCVAVV